MRRGLLVAGLAGSVLLALAPAASAHPLGNFTVNTADRLVVGEQSVQVQHVVDSAEIPTLQLAQSPDGPDADHDGRTDEAELAAWSARQCAALAPRLVLRLDDERAPLTVLSAAARSVPGQAGLPTSRLECTFDSGRPAHGRTTFTDPTSAGRTGWREVSAKALCGRLTDTGGLPDASPSRLLTSYPQDLLSSPLDVTQASFTLTGGGTTCRADGAGTRTQDRILPRGVDRLTAGYTSFVSRQHLTLPVALLALVLSVALGCGHAVAPGHGKTVIAAYLVGQRGTRRQAVWLGATVTATHTAGVLLLGALLSLTSVAAPERFVPATEVASGLLLGGVGAFLLRRAARARRDGAEHRGDHSHEHPPHEHHDHDHDDHHDHHDHHDHDDHDHDDHDHHDAEPGPAAALQLATREPRTAPHRHGRRPHSHLPTTGTPLGWRTLATMGVAGGLVPSPSALVVLLGASALGRPVFGAVLVVGYGLGMALTLTLAGLLLLRARAVLDTQRFAHGRLARVVPFLPSVTAVVVLLVGALVVLRGLLTLSALG